MGQAGSIDKKIVEEEQMKRKKCLGESQSSKLEEKIDVQKSLVTYEPGRKFTDKINKVILSDFRVQVVSAELIGQELRSFPMNFKLMVSHRET
jgi:hypothetical protein